MNAGEDLQAIAAAVCVVAVALGVVPVLTGVYQYLLVPVHSVRNHLRRAQPYLPRIAVLIPAWNEAAVLTASLTRLMNLEYPQENLRVYVIDDASTDETPAVVADLVEKWPERIVHLRREQGGQGKAHTLNHGLEHVLAEDWCEAVLITDADVIFLPDSVRRMARHLADPKIGAVTGYIREGSGRPGSVSRFIGFEYVTAQAAARRAQNVLGALACLAGGAQLHARDSLVAVGGRIDTSTLAEDTFTTILTQLNGRKVVFEPYAQVLAEEPDSINALWKQRVRWARGNVRITTHFRDIWFRPSRRHRLGSVSFGLIWFSVFLLPVANLAASLGLIGLYVIDSVAALQAFRALWWVSATAYIFVTLTSLLIDTATARKSWVQGLLFPGLGSILVMIAAWFPGFLENTVTGWLGLPPIPAGATGWIFILYAWNAMAMALAWGLKGLERMRGGRWPSRLLLYVVGFGPLLCAITLDAYVKEWRKKAAVWDKTVKIGRVVG
jgi:cellulose synthase/poly-beta-1,6-N-acetylglucosamine synthase-like glycosyltransferase